MGAPSEIDALVAAWAELVGAALAAHSRPQTVRGGVLVVLADGAAWAGQLRYLDQVLVDAHRRGAPRGDRPRGPGFGGARSRHGKPEKPGRETGRCPCLLVDFRQW